MLANTTACYQAWLVIIGTFHSPSSDLGPYLGLLSIDCMVDSRILKSPKGRADLSVLPSAESVKSLFRF